MEHTGGLKVSLQTNPQPVKLTRASAVHCYYPTTTLKLITHPGYVCYLQDHLGSCLTTHETRLDIKARIIILQMMYRWDYILPYPCLPCVYITCIMPTYGLSLPKQIFYISNLSS
jgi:hypothetical protein